MKNLIAAAAAKASGLLHIQDSSSTGRTLFLLLLLAQTMADFSRLKHAGEQVLQVKARAKASVSLRTGLA
ncbi:MAG: hypothetical protein GX251_04995 [Firmicutes bacterium]|nr:hypothetical protein [Bacillota bacterium]